MSTGSGDVHNNAPRNKGRTEPSGQIAKIFPIPSVAGSGVHGPLKYAKSCGHVSLINGTLTTGPTPGDPSSFCRNGIGGTKITVYLERINFGLVIMLL